MEVANNSVSTKRSRSFGLKREPATCRITGALVSTKQIREMFSRSLPAPELERSMMEFWLRRSPRSELSTLAGGSSELMRGLGGSPSGLSAARCYPVQYRMARRFQIGVNVKVHIEPDGISAAAPRRRCAKRQPKQGKDLMPIGYPAVLDLKTIVSMIAITHHLRRSSSTRHLQFPSS
jgi:hypothetical protein